MSQPKPVSYVKTPCPLVSNVVTLPTVLLVQMDITLLMVNVNAILPNTTIHHGNHARTAPTIA